VGEDGFLRRLKDRRAGRERRCDECGDTWAIGRPPKPRHFEGSELTAHGQSAASLVGDLREHAPDEDVAVPEALGHCPQCGSGHFTEYRAGHDPAGPGPR
jgi:hypothetical protein